MSPINHLGLLAFAAVALAVPSAHDHRHLHHARQAPSAAASGAAPARAGPAGVVSNLPSVPSNPVTGPPATKGLAGGKRGLAYNSAADCTAFLGSSQISWAYNWIGDSNGVSSQVMYIPTLHSNDPSFTSSWAQDAQKGIDAGAQYLFSFNEPDIPSQANMDPKTAADAWKEHMEPFAGKAKLVAPSVSNSASPGQGLDWLKQFMALCSDCSISAVNQHWYDSTSNDVNYLKQQVQSAASQSGLPVFLTEFAFIGSDEDISQSLSEAMSYLDSDNNVIGYSYFMVGDGYLNDGTRPSPYGLTYIGGQ